MSLHRGLDALLSGVSTRSIVSATVAHTDRRLFETHPVVPGARERFGASYWEKYSHRLDRNVGLYTDIGYRHWLLIESNAGIPWYTERPTPVSICIDGRDVECRFDMVYESRHGWIECCRILNRSQRHSRAFRPEWLAAEIRWCTARGFRHSILAPRSIDCHRWLIHNWHQLLPWLSDADPQVMTDIYRIARAQGGCTVEEIAGAFAGVTHTDLLGSIAQLLHRGICDSPNFAAGPYGADTLIRSSHDHVSI